MKRLIPGVLTVVIALSATVTAFAFDFSSDMVTTSNGQKYTSKIYMQGKKLRMESPQQPGYNIMRSDKNVMWMVMPEQKSYMEMKVDPSKQPRTEEKVEGEVSRRLLGPETIDGRPTDKYEIIYKEKENTTKMHQWMARDIKFPVKTAAVDGSWTVEYKNIKMGSQADTLFEVPAGYTKMGMPNMKDALQGGSRSEINAAPADNQVPETKDEEGGATSGGFLKKLPKLPLPKLPRW
jgi:hypothetical protein